MNYKQLTEKRELRAFYEIGDYYKIKVRMVVALTHLSDFGGSCLTDEKIEVPDANLNNIDIP